MTAHTICLGTPSIEFNLGISVTTAIITDLLTIIKTVLVLFHMPLCAITYCI